MATAELGTTELLEMLAGMMLLAGVEAVAAELVIAEIELSVEVEPSAEDELVAFVLPNEDRPLDETVCGPATRPEELDADKLAESRVDSVVAYRVLDVEVETFEVATELKVEGMPP